MKINGNRVRVFATDQNLRKEEMYRPPFLLIDFNTNNYKPLKIKLSILEQLRGVVKAEDVIYSEDEEFEGTNNKRGKTQEE